MKVFRLAKAELNKLFQRPAIFLMVGFLVIALILVSFFYNPTLRTDTRINYQGANTTEIHTQFQSEKNEILNELSLKVDEINEYTYNINNNISKLNDFKNLLTNTENTFQEFHSELLNNKNVETIANKLKAYRQKILEIQSFLATIDENIDFFITTSQLNELKAFFEKLIKDIPANTTNYSVENFVELGNFLVLNRSFSNNVYPITNTLTKISLDVKDVNAIVEQYYDNIAVIENNKLGAYEIQIENFYQEHIGSNEDEDLSVLNNMFSNYKSIVLMAKESLENSFTLLKVENISNSELNNYIGFENINKYSLQETVTKNTYLLDNDKFDIDFANNFNFGTTAGFSTSAYDFVVFAMQILTFIIAVFCLFFGAGLIAGEHSGKTMKMLAIRPYSRNKIYIGKFIACISFMLILLLVSFVASFIVGVILYGIDLPSVLIIINATSAVALHPFVVLLIYLASCILNLIFYISLAMLLSVIFRSSTVAVLTSFIVYIVTIICNLLLASASWFKVLPIAHLDIFKYFGGASSSGGFLTFNIIVDANLWLSLGYLIGIILVFNLISLIVFKRRNIA